MKYEILILSALLHVIFVSGYPQQQDILGTVKQKDTGIPLFGIEVVIKNTSNGTITDFEGNFKIKAHIGDELEFIDKGYKKKVIAIQNTNKLHVFLEKDLSRRERRKKTAHVAEINEENIAARRIKENKKEKKKSNRKIKKGYVTGKVLAGDTNWELPFVLIIRLNKENKTVTDLDGFFEIKADSGDILLFKADGYMNKYSPIRNNTDLNIMMTKSAEFPGGEDEMNKFIRNNIRYPDDARNLQKKGVVHLNFLIEEDGTISNIKVIKPVFESLDKEAIRIVKLFPKWNPAKYNMKPVTMKYTISIDFKITTQ